MEGNVLKKIRWFLYQKNPPGSLIHTLNTSRKSLRMQWLTLRNAPPPHWLNPTKKQPLPSAGRSRAYALLEKEQFKFKLEVLIKFCVVTINKVYNLKICTFICDDKLNCIQFEENWHSIQFNFPLYMIHSWIPILQQDGQVTFHVHRTHVHRMHVLCTHTRYLLHSKVPLLKKSYIVETGFVLLYSRTAAPYSLLCTVYSPSYKSCLMYRNKPVLS